MDSYSTIRSRRSKIHTLESKHYGNTEIIVQSSLYGTILNYGCGEKTYVGNVDDFDEHDPENDFAKFHSKSELKSKYDCVVFSQVLEHMDLNEAVNKVNEYKPITDRIIIVLPNAENNIFVNFYTMDLEHKAILNATDFCSILEDNDFRISNIIKSDIRGPATAFVTLNRLIFSFLFGNSPFWDYIIILDRVK